MADGSHDGHVRVCKRLLGCWLLWCMVKSAFNCQTLRDKHHSVIGRPPVICACALFEWPSFQLRSLFPYRDNGVWSLLQLWCQQQRRIWINEMLAKLVWRRAVSPELRQACLPSWPSKYNVVFVMPIYNTGEGKQTVSCMACAFNREIEVEHAGIM